MPYHPYRQSLPLLMAFAAVFLAACDFNDVRNPADRFKLVIGLEPVNTTVAAAFYDASSKALVNDELTLTFEGKDAGAVIDLFSDPAPTLKVKGGVVSFGIRNEAVPADGAPVTFDVAVTGPGYIGTMQKLVLRKTGDHDVRVYLMKRDQLPATATEAKATPTGAGGATTQAVTVQTPQTGQAQVTATVPAGTVAQTASGQALTGAVTTQVAYLDPQRQAVSQALPGGIAPRVEQNGQTTNSTLSTAVVMQVRMTDASGQVAAATTKPLKVEVDFSPTQLNPVTGATYKPGDKVSFLSYDEAKGAWVHKGEVTLTASTAAGKTLGNARAVLELNEELYLSQLYIFAHFLFTPTCGNGAQGASFTLNRNGYTGPVNAVMLAGATFSYAIKSGNTFNMKEMPGVPLELIPNRSATITVNIPGQAASQTVTFNPCSGNYTINLPTPAGTLITSDFTVTPQCPTGQAVRVQPPSGSTLTYWKQGASEDTGSTITLQRSNWTFENNALTQARISIPGLEQGATYNFKSYFPPNAVATRQEVITGPVKNITMDAGAACSN